ncbi:alpha/beta fold hydrolase [Maricaulis parjimensis]|uniref:alpha/beta fold hydrolase n=1 Tax=Maricaulis parjimensis TaxID=144023 RepID=UPI00193A3199|nr:alpha/beta hydrolase [Maricaulis parjimensis]
MPQAIANGITIEYDIHGPDNGAPLVLITGLGSQMTRWPPSFLDALAERGFRVVYFDNRDMGLTTHFTEAGIPDFKSVVTTKAAGGTPDVPYHLDDMAADVVGLMDALGIEKAHVAGASMGGMIGQLVAADHGHRALSLTSIMSTTGNPDLPRSTPEAQAMLATPSPDPKTDREAFLERAVQSSRVIGSPAYPIDAETLKARAAADADRCHNPAGFARQYAAILAAPDRRAKLAGVSCPVMVVHGADDPLVTVEGGKDTAAAIPGSTLEIIDGMGHDLPPQVHDRVASAIARVAGL